MMMPFIQVNQMSCSIKGKVILTDINLKLEQSQCVALVGPNGSGKTTLGKALAGILPFQKGSIYLQNESIKEKSLSSIGTVIGYLFQNPEKQIFASTVAEELSFALKYKGFPADEIEKSVDDMLRRFELNHLKNASTYFLSQGEKQRLAIAALLMNHPQYLILDEPTTGLDSKRKEQLGHLLDSLKDKVGMLLISHDKSFIRRHAYQTLKMEGGQILHD